MAHELLVADYLAECAEARTTSRGDRYSVSTLESRLAAIAHYFAEAGLPHPGRTIRVAEILTAAERSRGFRSASRDATYPMMASTLTSIVAAADEHARGWRARVAARRDIALLMVAYAGGLRPAELVAVTAGAVSRGGEVDSDQTLIRVGPARSSTDSGDYVVLWRGSDGRTCPRCALMRWLSVLAVFDRAVAAAGDLGAGEIAIQRLLRRDDSPVDDHVCDREWPAFRRITVPVFRPLARDGLPHDCVLSTRSVSTIVKRRATDAGVKGDVVAKMRGMSARAGAATQALSNGASPRAVAAHLRYRDPRSVLVHDLGKPGVGEVSADQWGL